MQLEFSIFMYRNRFFYTAIIAIAVLMGACSLQNNSLVQKRKYRKGFYVKNKSLVLNKKNEKSIDLDKSALKEQKKNATKTKRNKPIFYASNNDNINLIAQQNKIEKRNFYNKSVTGTTNIAEEKSNIAISKKNAENNTPVSKIDNDVDDNKPQTDKKPKMHPLSITSGVSMGLFTVLSLINAFMTVSALPYLIVLLPFIMFFSGYIALKKIKQHPEIYKGHTLAYIGLAAGTILSAIIILGLFLVIGILIFF